VYTRASLTEIFVRKTARVEQVGEDPRACPARGERSRRTHADILATILAQKSAGMSVSFVMLELLSLPFLSEKKDIRTRRNPRDDPRAEVGGMSPVEFQLYSLLPIGRGHSNSSDHVRTSSRSTCCRPDQTTCPISCSSNTMTELQFHISLNIKRVISDMPFLADLLPSTEE